MRSSLSHSSSCKFEGRNYASGSWAGSWGGPSCSCYRRNGAHGLLHVGCSVFSVCWIAWLTTKGNNNSTHVYGLSESYGPCCICAKQPEWETLPLAKQAELNARQGFRSPLQNEVVVLDDETFKPVPWYAVSSSFIFWIAMLMGLAGMAKLWVRFS